MIETIIVISGIVAVASSIMFFVLSKKTTQRKKQEIAIEALSSIWTKHKNVTLSLEELAGIWRASNIPIVENKEEIQYDHIEIQDLYDRYVKGKTFSNSPAGDVIRDILSLLDKEGDCPSVVNNKGEPESYTDKNAYDILAQVPLYKHTINVAENMIEAFRNSAAMLPKVLITALGHDLGKLPSMRKKLYSMGDHPLISITILEGLKGYKDLQFKDEVSKAINEHHRTPKGMLSEKLKEADHQARRMEMAEFGLKEKDETSTSSDTEEDVKPKVKSSMSDIEEDANTDRSIGVFTEISSEVDKNMFSPPESEKEREHKSIPKEVPLKWFDSEAFLKELKPYINRLDGQRWRAFSMSNGYVYFQTGVIEEVIKKLGKDDPDVALMDTSKETKRSIMFSVVQRLKREKDAIARGLIKDTFFGGNFTVTMVNGKSIKGYYTPFVAEAFSESVSSLEGLKSGKLKEIERVEPLITSEQ